MFSVIIFETWDIFFNDDGLSFWLMEYIEYNVDSFRYKTNELNNLLYIIKTYSDNQIQAESRLRSIRKSFIRKELYEIF